MPRPAFVLVHSPLVGPATWTAVAEELRGDGEAVVPSLVEATRTGRPAWKAQAEAVAEAAGRAGIKESIVVGHSGAGALLPVVGQALDGVRGYVFVDAGLPEPGTTTRLASLHPSLRSHLENLEHDGMLPPWSEWWGDGALERLVPDERVRAAFVAELEPVPLRVFEETLPEVRGWPDAPCGYLRLSEAYEGEEAEAAGRGWPVARIRGSHLEMLLQPHEVARALLQLLGRMGIEDR